ncbi:hypothetical protein PSY81_24150, partial [Shigella flexneri]|nr:hypothetical protein [Shigella flexneri]
VVFLSHFSNEIKTRLGFSARELSNIIFFTKKVIFDNSLAEKPSRVFIPFFK